MPHNAEPRALLARLRVDVLQNSEEGIQTLSDKPDVNRSTPESEAVTGGIPAAAEAPPQTRARGTTVVAVGYVYALGGLLMVLVALFADQTGSQTLATAILAVALVALAAMSFTGFPGAVIVSVMGVLISAALTATGLFADDRGFPELARIVAGAGAFIGSFAALAASGRDGGRTDSSGSEPEAGVENV